MRMLPHRVNVALSHLTLAAGLVFALVGLLALGVVGVLVAAVLSGATAGLGGIAVLVASFCFILLAALLLPLAIGVLHKNRLAIGAATVIVPIAWWFALALLYDSVVANPNSANTTNAIALSVTLILALLIAGVYVRELIRNWHRK